MGKKSLKRIVLYLIGIGAGSLSLYGWHPVAIGYYGAAVVALGKTGYMFLAIMTGLLWRDSAVDVCRYGISMLLFVILYQFQSKDNTRKHWMLNGMLCALCLMSMNLTKYVLVETDKIQLFMGMLESVCTFSAFILFYIGIEWFVRARASKMQKKVVAGVPRLKASAEMLEKLSDCFEKLPVKKEVLSEQDMEEMFEELIGRFCGTCKQYQECWETCYQSTYKAAYSIFCEIENGEKPVFDYAATSELAQNCIHYRKLLKEAKQIFEKTKNNFLWYNRLIENRSAVALQLNEVARMMINAAEELNSQTVLPDELDRAIRKKLRLHQIIVTELFQKKGPRGRQELYVTMHTMGSRCIAVRDVAVYLSEVLDKRMEADKDSRLILNQNEETVLFVEEAKYKIVHATAKAAKMGERISGDNFSFCFTNGLMSACLSDGMGSGLLASQSSELVIELLENFLEAGFCKETALRMMNATLIMNSQNGKYSTVDVAEVDLYAGVCEFVKMGASISFIKRENKVEIVRLESLPVGAFYEQEFESVIKTLYDGDYVIMISDGILSALPKHMTEQVLVQLIEKIDCVNPKEMANEILEQVLMECHYEPMDDMTVLVFGIWKR